MEIGSAAISTFIVPLYNVIFCLFVLTLRNSLIKKSLVAPAWGKIAVSLRSTQFDQFIVLHQPDGLFV